MQLDGNQEIITAPSSLTSNLGFKSIFKFAVDICIFFSVQAEEDERASAGRIMYLPNGQVAHIDWVGKIFPIQGIQKHLATDGGL